MFVSDAPVKASSVIKLVPDTAPLITKALVVILVKPLNIVVDHEAAEPAEVLKVVPYISGPDIIPVAVRLNVVIAAVLTMFVEFKLKKFKLPLPEILRKFIAD